MYAATRLALATLLAALSFGPLVASAQPPRPPSIPFTSPNTDHCPNKLVPGKAIDLSEVPPPGEPAPVPLPAPRHPAGGPRLSACGLVAPAGPTSVPGEISASAWMVSDLDTGKVLAAKDPHGRYRPASTIKVLLAIVALRTLDLRQTVTGTYADADVEGSRAGIGPGGRYTNDQLMQALVMASGNDAAHAIAAQLGGDKAAVAKMNEEAKRLGALDTRAATPSGLDGPGMSTSAYDLSLIFREAMSIPKFAGLIGTEQVQFPGHPPDPRIPNDKEHPPFPVVNDNKLLYNYDGALGGKTGYTDDARQTFVAAAQRGGHRLTVTLLHADVVPKRPWEQAARLLDYGFALLASGAEPVGAFGPATAPPDHPYAPPAVSAPARGWGWQRTLAVFGGAGLVLLLLWAAFRQGRAR